MHANATQPVAVFVLTHPWMQKMVRQAAPPGFDVRFLDAGDGEAAASLLPQADFLMTVELPPAWVSLLQRCRLVQLQGVGYDAIDMAGLSRAGIPLAATPEGTIIGVAEHTLMLILALYRQLVPIHESMRAGHFDSLSWRSRSYSLYGKVLGLVGFGRIGQRVGQLAAAFSAHVIYYDIAPAAVEATEASYRPLEALLAEADIVSVHAALTPQTRGLFNAQTLARMKPGALFINTSRGGTYDMDALYAELQSGRLLGAGLDVFNPEPVPPDHPLLRLPNVICTPHIAAGTVDAHLEKARAQFANFQRVLAGQPPDNLVTIMAAENGRSSAHA
jgi:phosphoglycerate dehydrogenase-like enzyme